MKPGLLNGKMNIEKIKFSILTLLVASLPFHYFLSSIFIIAGSVLFVFSIYAKKQFGLKKLDLLSLTFILYFIIELLGLAYTERENIRIGLFVLEKHQALVLLPLFFLDFSINNDRRAFLLIVFVASCLVASLACLAVNVSTSWNEYGLFFNEWGFSHDRMSEPIGMQAVYFALYLAFVILILVLQLINKYRLFNSIKRGAYILLILYFFTFLIALGARTIIGSLMLIIIINLIYQGISQRVYGFFLVVAIVPLIFAAAIFLNPVVKTRFIDMLHSSYEESSYGSYFARLLIWKPGWEAMGENIWFGVGTGDDQMELDKKFVKFNYPEGVQLFNMHNQFLQTMLAYGIFGSIVFLGIFYFQFKSSLARGDLIYLSFLVLFLCGCLTESMLNRNKGIIFLIVFSLIFSKSEISNWRMSQTQK